MERYRLLVAQLNMNKHNLDIIEKEAMKGGIIIESSELVFSTREVFSKIKKGFEKKEPYNVLIMQQRLDQGKPVSIADIEKLKRLSPQLKILLCVSEDEQGSKYLEDLFNIGIYTAFYSAEGSMETVVPLIKHGRTMIEAQKYYNLPEDSYAMRAKTGYMDRERLNRNLMLIKNAETDIEIRNTADRLKRLLKPLEFLYVIRHLHEEDLEKMFFCPNMGIFFDMKRYKEDKDEAESGNFFKKRFRKKELILSDYIIEPEELSERINRIEKNRMSSTATTASLEENDSTKNNTEEITEEAKKMVQNEPESIAMENMTQETEEEELEQTIKIVENENYDNSNYVTTASTSKKDDGIQIERNIVSEDANAFDASERSKQLEQNRETTILNAGINNKQDVLELLENSFSPETIATMLSVLQENTEKTQKKTSNIDNPNQEPQKNKTETATASFTLDEISVIQENSQQPVFDKEQKTTINSSLRKKTEEISLERITTNNKKERKNNPNSHESNSTRTAKEHVHQTSSNRKENKVSDNKKISEKKATINSASGTSLQNKQPTREKTIGNQNISPTAEHSTVSKEDRKVKSSSKKAISFSGIRIGTEKKGQEFLVINTSKNAGATSMTLVLAHTFKKMYPDKSVCVCTNTQNFDDYAAYAGENLSKTGKISINNIDVYENVEHDFLEKKATYDAVFVDFGRVDNLQKAFYTKRLILVTQGAPKHYPGLDKALDFIQSEGLTDVSLIVNMHEFLPEKAKEIKERFGARKKVVNIGYLEDLLQPASKLEPIVRV